MSTSITKNRLLHLSDLPMVQKYSPMDINKLLPIHYSTLRDNVLTMIHYEAVSFTPKQLLHDPNLAINSTNYSQIKGGWCEDYDEKNEVTSTVCVRKSIEVGVLILNYLEALCQATVKHTHREKEDHDTCQIISKGECFTQTRIVHDDELMHSRLSSLGSSHLRAPKDTKQSELKNTTDFHAIDFDKQHECFQSQSSIVISYNIYKKNKKYIFLTAVNECFTMNFFNAISLYRHWNLQRLKISNHLAMSYDKLSRLNVYFEHLFSIARGFVFSSLQAKPSRASFAPTIDPNDNKKHLKILLENFEIGKDLQNSSELIFQKLNHQQGEIMAVLDDTLRVYRFCFTYKMESDSEEAKSSFMLKLTSQLCKVLSTILTEIPINVNTSYSFKSMHNEVTNQVVVQMIFNYKSSLSKRIFLTEEEVNLSVRNLVGFLNRENYEEVQRSERNVADEVFKSSYLIFNKYNQILENTESQQTNGELKNKLSQVRLHGNGSSESFSNVGLNRNSSKKNAINNQSIAKSAVLSETSTIFSKSPGYSEIEIGYKKLLKSLEDRFQVNCILNPIKLRAALKEYLQPFQEINLSQALEKDEKQCLWFLGISNQLLTPDDIYHLILKFEDNADAICEYFMQEYNLEKMVEVGKLFSGKLQQMFKEYLSVEKGFGNLRYNLVVGFMKKFLQGYCLKSRQHSMKISESLVGSPVKQSRDTSPEKSKPSLHPDLNLTQLNMQDLIYLLQCRSYNCTQYKNLIHAFMPQIFTSCPQIQYISVILYHFYIHLLNNDHHQDLVASFIADLFYEVVFFTNELTSIALNNSRYRKNVIDLKQKKFYQVVRQGGFKNFGMQVRNLLIPQLINAQPIVEYEQLIVSTLRIQRPAFFKTVVKMIQGSFFSKNFNFLTNLIQSKGIYTDSIDRSVCMPFYPKELQTQLESMKNPTQKQPPKEQVNDALSNISRSQSGIFRDLISLNPDLKIAGLNLKEEYAKKMKEREDEEQKFTVNTFLDKIAKVEIEEAWEYIQLVLVFKDKVLQAEDAKSGLHIDSEMERNILYIKETFQHIYTKLSKIYAYIGLSDVVYEISKARETVS